MSLDNRHNRRRHLATIHTLQDFVVYAVAGLVRHSVLCSDATELSPEDRPVSRGFLQDNFNLTEELAASSLQQQE